MRVLSVTEDAPLSLANFRDFARIYHTGDDVQLNSALRAAIASWDETTRRPIRTTQYTQELQGCPHGWFFNAGPVNTVDSITHTDSSTGVTKTIDSAGYRVSYAQGLPAIQFTYDYAADEASARYWEINWTASTKPAHDAVQAILMMAATFYDERNELAPIQLSGNAVGWNVITSRYRWPAL